MDRSSVASFSAFGNLSIECRGPVGLPPPEGREAAIPATNYVYYWRPPKTIQQGLRPDFTIKLECDLCSDGLRRFTPVGGYEALIHKAFLAGLAILKRTQRLDRERLHSYCVMALIFKAVRQMREHFNRELCSARDLYIRPAGRESHDEWSLLPESIGLDQKGRGRPWSNRELVERGRAAARAVGIANPTMQQSIQYGFLEAARINPVHLKAAEVHVLVRMALFDLPQGKKPRRKVVNLVTERISTAIHNHLDDTSDQFEAWMSGPHSNLLKTLADQPQSRGGKLDREEVRRVILDRGWEAYQYVGNCVHAFANWFLKSLPDEMSAPERRLFEHLFMKQRYFGGLPLILVMERGFFLRPALTAIWFNPDGTGPIRVLHRLLSFYAEIAANRRAADRRFKPKGSSGTSGPKKHVQNLGTEDRHVESPGDRKSRTSAFAEHTRTKSQARMSAIAHQIRTQRGLPPRCRCGPLRVERISRADDQIELQCECDCGEISELMTVTMNEIRQSGNASGPDGLEASSID